MGGSFKIVEGGGGGGVAGRGARDELEDCSFRHLPIHSLEPTGGDSATNYPHLGKPPKIQQKDKTVFGED